MQPQVAQRPWEEKQGNYMRAREFIVENSIDDIIEDEADQRGDANLIDKLWEIRSTAHEKRAVPMIQAEALINMVRNMPGTELFSMENLLDAYKTNEAVKNLIDDIKDNKDGVKYIYLAKYADDPSSPEAAIASNSQFNPEKTVNSMAKRALLKRS